MVVIDTKSERYETWYTCVNQPCLEKKEEEQVYWQKLPRAKITIFFFLNDPPTTESYPLPLHDALPISRAFHEETCEPLENPLSVSVRRMRPIKSVRPVLLIRRDGNELYVESTAAPIRDGTGHVAGGVLVFHDVSESRQLNRRLSYHASHALLTGPVNRAGFGSGLGRGRSSAKGPEGAYAP